MFPGSPVFSAFCYNSTADQNSLHLIEITDFAGTTNLNRLDSPSSIAHSAAPPTL